MSPTRAAPPHSLACLQRGQPLGPGASSGVAEPAYRRKVAVSVGPLARLLSTATMHKVGRRPYAERTYLRHAGSAKSRARAVVLASTSASTKGRANASARSVGSSGRGGRCEAAVSTLSTHALARVSPTRASAKSRTHLPQVGACVQSITLPGLCLSVCQIGLGNGHDQ